jgi:diguanylate cyclase (GGDEF)-like protein
MSETRVTDDRTATVKLVVGGCVLAAVGLALTTIGRPFDVPVLVALPWATLMLAVLYAVAETSKFHLEVRGQALSVSLSELPLVLGLFLVPPQYLLLARLAPSALLFLIRRTAAAKIWFNLGLFTAEIGLATIVLRVLNPQLSVSPENWAGTYLTVLVVTTFGAAAVMAAMTMLGSKPSAEQRRQMLVTVTLSAVVSATLALMAVLVLQASSAALVLLAILTVVVALTHRGYYRLVRRHAGLNQLFAFTQTVGVNEEPDGVITHLLGQARELLNAETAVVRVRPPTPDDPGHDEDLLGSAEPVLLPRGSNDPAHRRWLAEHGLRDALLVPLHDDEDVVAVLQVANRRGAAGTFTDDDLQVLQTLTAHAEVLWQASQLMERLRYDAQHDTLTGLANRGLLLDKLDELLTGGGSGAVLLLNLNRFKDVNEALGHAVGDALLEQVADRLRSHVPIGACVARIAGDEFAVLLPTCTSPESALATARAARGALTGPFEVAGTFLEVGAAVGVALVPADGQDAATVLRRADIAMSQAKQASGGVARYEPAQDRRSTDLLELAGELRRAVEAEQVVMHYQPKESLTTGRIVGFEALARWYHPVRGQIMPDVFIPLAERTGLIGLLTHSATRQALAECRRWLAGSVANAGVAVNLAPRQLLEPGVTGIVAELLEAADVPAAMLTLEITESSIMTDPDAAVRALQQLRDLGVRLAIDDFGTGYSSLSYLQRLPVHEVKIDKGFIRPMPCDPGATAIVQTIIDLAHTLGLTVVAEGVEDEATRQLLVQVGCDVAQGFGLSAPMSAEELPGWMLEHRRATRNGRGTPRNRVG